MCVIGVAVEHDRRLVAEAALELMRAMIRVRRDDLLGGGTNDETVCRESDC